MSYEMSADESGWETSSASSSTSSGPTSSSEFGEAITPACTNCNKTQAEISHTLKRYWKVHKKSCGKAQQDQRKANTAFGTTYNLGANSLKGMGDTNYLHQFPQKDAFCQLIDCYRLRIEDDYTFSGDAGGLYAGENPLPDFRRFLRLAEKRKDLLPPWWSPAKRKECERLALGKEWPCLNAAVEKSDIVEHYGDPLMPMKLRSLAEKVYKCGLGD